MPKISIPDLPAYSGSGPITRIAGALGAYEGRAISAAFGMEKLGAAIETLMPGSASSHRHWHERTDELVVVLEGEIFLVENEGETLLHPGDIAVFPAGIDNGHCLKNRSDAPARFLVAGTRDPQDRCIYPDAGIIMEPDGRLVRTDGRPVADGSP
ncbi:cupin domain-containing protein [Pyruvatibacter mobilis]|uniref:cupin domain-containing protein n=1 Tax=Pyruvatibacter mobilis TaxID=1712261 RepID=UPI003BA9A682